jgi:hypothetical protein
MQCWIGVGELGIVHLCLFSTIFHHVSIVYSVINISTHVINSFVIISVNILSWTPNVNNSCEYLTRNYSLSPIGHVKKLHNDSIVEVKIDGDIAQLLDLGCWEIHKSFNRGNLVQILASEYKGRAGFIVGLEEESAMIYSLNAGIQSSLSHWQEVSGEEVSLYI